MSEELFFRGAAPIADSEILSSIKTLDITQYIAENTPYRIDTKVKNEFLDFLPQWILASQLNTIDGLQQFKYRYVISGITQAFDDFYMRHANKNIVFLPGEYPYLRRFITNWRFYKNNFNKNDVLVLSAPFSATGSLHTSYAEIMEAAEKNNVPTLIDCAFFGICADLDLNLNYKCIESVCFSLSKTLASGCFRAGIEFTNIACSSISIQNQWNYLQLLSAKITLELAKIYTADFIYNKYRSAQLDICKSAGLTPSNTVIFGLSCDEKYSKFELDNTINRCCISSAISAYYQTQKKYITEHPWEK